MSRAEIDRLRDILDAISDTEDAVGGLSFETFVEVGPLIAALCHYILVISEASRHISEERKAQFPDIGWRQVADIGNLVRHVYFKVDPERIWNIYKNDMPRLRAAVLRMIEDFPDENTS